MRLLVSSSGSGRAGPRVPISLGAARANFLMLLRGAGSRARGVFVCCVFLPSFVGEGSEDSDNDDEKEEGTK